MHLIRTLLVCLACLAAAVSPVRAMSACPMQAQAMRIQAAMPPAPHRRPRHSCPAPMSCCVPTAAHLAAPAMAVVRRWRDEPRPSLSHDLARDDAARPRLLRPPTSA